MTGELYACHQDELIAIKEQGYLQKEMTEEKYLNSQANKRVTDPKKGLTQQIAPTATEDVPKIPLTFELEGEKDNPDRDREKHFQDNLLQQNRQTMDEATQILQEQQRESH